jgi:hypothetical protein
LTARSENPVALTAWLGAKVLPLDVLRHSARNNGEAVWEFPVFDGGITEASWFPNRL